ncbi:2316_t:CDS:2, partial [Cetraspora pellucida]
YGCSCSLIGPLCVREAFSVLGSVLLGSCGSGDGGRDIICRIAEITIVIECKNYSSSHSICREVVFAHKTVVRRYTRETGHFAVDIVVAPFMGAFFRAAERASNSSGDM